MQTLPPMTGTVTRTGAVQIECVDVPAGARLRGHGHDAPHLCFVLNGAFEERHLGRWRPVGQGTLRASPAGDEHDLAFGPPSTCLLVIVAGDPAGITARVPAERRFRRSERIRTLARALAESLTARSPSPLTIETETLELLAAATSVSCRQEGAPPAWLVRVRDRLYEEAAYPPSASELAADAGYHPVYVARAFRTYFGLGLGQYARLARAERARRLLVVSSAPLAQVALRAGYADQSHLTRAFRRLFGATPKEVRRRRGQVVQVARIQDLSPSDG